LHNPARIDGALHRRQRGTGTGALLWPKMHSHFAQMSADCRRPQWTQSRQPSGGSL